MPCAEQRGKEKKKAQGISGARCSSKWLNERGIWNKAAKTRLETHYYDDPAVLNTK